MKCLRTHTMKKSMLGNFMPKAKPRCGRCQRITRFRGAQIHETRRLGKSSEKRFDRS